MEGFGILIVEDNPGFALELEMLVIEAGYNFLGTIDHSEKALSFIKKRKPDLVIMDIDIHGNKNGVEVAHEIKDDNVPVIFITSHKDVETYNLAKQARTFAYLVKPFDMLTLQSAIELAVKSLAESQDDLSEEESWSDDLILQDSFLIKTKGILRKVKCVDINYVASDWNYCTLHCDNRKYAVKISMKKIQQLLGDFFMPIHKSYLVNLNRIEGIDTSANKVLIRDSELPLGRTYKQDIIKRFRTLK